MFSRRSLFAALAGALTLTVSRPRACLHDWACIGVIGRSEHYHYVCRNCRAEHIEVHNIWRGDKTREGRWSVRQYRAAFGYEPSRSRLRKRIAEVAA